MKYNKRITGQIIGQLRVQRGMTQEVLSGLAGIARSHLGMIESGSKNPNVETLWRIAGALDLSLSELFLMVEQAHLQEEHAYLITRS
jgi:transcriptional regulator with XRE-family HTH domain